LFKFLCRVFSGLVVCFSGFVQDVNVYKCLVLFCPMPKGFVMKESAVSSEILTVMFVDIAGYTSTTAQLSRDRIQELLDVFEKISLPVIERYAGRLIKKIGDAFLLTFKSPTNAVLCGIALQNAFRRYKAMQPSALPLRIRAAMHTGEVLVRDGDVFGDAVNTAARIEGVAEPGQVTFSEAVFSAMNKNEVPIVHLGSRRLKGLRYPVRLFRIRNQRDDSMAVKKKVRQWVAKAVFLGFVILGSVLVLRYLWQYSGILSRLALP
jgi:class 3 adenylate cyclase